MTAAVLFVAFLAPAPARADETLSIVQARAKTSAPRPGALVLPTPAPSRPGFSNAFVYVPGPQSLAVRGRLSVGRSGVYVPYYGNVSGDPLHPGVQGAAGIGFGFHNNLDISVYNNGFSYGNGPGAESLRTNPSLSFSIRF